MPELKINLDPFCSNHHALIAVAQFMMANKANGYKRTRNVTVENRDFNVLEHKRDDEMTSCNGDFSVTTLGSM